MALKSLHKLTALLVLIAALCFSGEALAKDVAGRIGLGMSNSLTAGTIGDMPSTPASQNAPNFGLSLKYWINNDWAVGGILGFAYGSANAAIDGYSDTDSFWAFTLDLKGFYNFVKSDNANLALFLALHMQKENSTLKRPEGPKGSNLGFSFAFGLAPEIFVTDDFAISLEFGLTFRVQEGFAFGFSGDNVLGGFGFHYYF